ncbi:MAG: dihydroneopterin aldolase [Burkholderiales bacterium]|nr:dihydroneopterin aldolase [Burkholderiales bacterium]
MDSIFIHDLRVAARIGVYEWETHLPQTVRLDLVIAVPSPLPFQTGRIADALDYAQVVARLKAFAAHSPPPLLERFAERIAELVQGEFGAPWVRVRAAKLGALPDVREIGIEIERGTRPGC